jgi:hypothetical protein
MSTDNNTDKSSVLENDTIMTGTPNKYIFSSCCFYFSCCCCFLLIIMIGLGISMNKGGKVKIPKANTVAVMPSGPCPENQIMNTSGECIDNE